MTAEERREKEIAEATEKAREHLYRGGMHHNGNFHAFIGNPNTGLGGMIDLSEVLAFYAMDAYEAGRSSMQSEAAQVAENLPGAKNDEELWTPARERIAAAIRALKP